MAEENKIDNLFRSKLDSHEIKPSERSRIGIEAELERQRALFYKRRVNNYRIATVALGVVLILLVTYFNLGPFDFQNPVIENTEKEISPSENLNSSENNSKVQSNLNKVMDQLVEEEDIIKNKNENPSEFKINVLNINKGRVEGSNIYSKYEQYFTLAKPAELTEISYAREKPGFEKSLIHQLKVHDQPEAYSNVNSETTTAMVVTETEITSNTTRAPVSIALFYSPHYSYCVFKDNTPNNNINEEQMYHDLEKSEFSYSTGFSIRYHLSDRWGVSAGLTYATVIKSISLLTVYANKNSNNEMYYAYSTSSGIIEIPDKSNTAHVGDSLKLDGDGEKILKFIHIPIMAKYSFPKDKITWFVNAGPSVNFLVQDQAKINSGNREEVISNKTQGLKKTSFGFTLGAGMEYKLTNNINFLFEPVFKGTITSITENTTVENYPYSIGANVGLTVNF